MAVFGSKSKESTKLCAQKSLKIEPRPMQGRGWVDQGGHIGGFVARVREAGAAV